MFLGNKLWTLWLNSFWKGYFNNSSFSRPSLKATNTTKEHAVHTYKRPNNLVGFSNYTFLCTPAFSFLNCQGGTFENSLTTVYVTGKYKALSEINRKWPGSLTLQSLSLFTPRLARRRWWDVLPTIRMESSATSFHLALNCTGRL